jgi:hypothetical protein
MSQPTLTPEQAVAILILKSKGWKTEPETLNYAIGEGRNGVGCVMIKVTGETGNELWLGIEPDGYTHS